MDLDKVQIIASQLRESAKDRRIIPLSHNLEDIICRNCTMGENDEPVERFSEVRTVIEIKEKESLGDWPNRLIVIEF